jgi:hypothetical protein
MKTIHDIRRDNLRIVIFNLCGGSQTNFANRVGLAQPSFVSRLLTDSPCRKGIGSKMARKWEQELTLPTGWFDQDRSDDATDDLTGPLHDAKGDLENALFRLLHAVQRLNVSYPWLDAAIDGAETALSDSLYS